MTVEELEIIVTAKVEEAVKQFKKIVPEIKKAVQQAQESFKKMDTKEVKNKIQQAVQFVKKKIQDLKKSNQNNEIKLTVNNKEAQKQISQIQKEIDSLQQKINARQMKLNITNNALDKMRSETNQEVIKDMPNAGNKAIKQETYNRLNSDAQYTSLVKESDKLNNEVIKYNSLLEMAKQEMSSLGNETQKTSTAQNKMSSFFGAFKGKLEQVKGVISSIRNVFSKIPNITKYITNHIKGMGKGLKSGLGHVLKYATALFGLRTIYNTLQQCASSWLSSQNEGAKQLSTNIEYMKNSLGSVLAPVIQWITNLLYNMMKAVQSVVYALFRVNIFANASSKAYSNMAGSAKKAKKESQGLAGIHSELNNISDNDNSDSGSGSSSSTPSFDLSQMDSQMSLLAQKLYDFFKPLKESWDNYGNGLIEQVKITAGQVGGLIASVWGSFENIITNGTVYSILENVLAIIGNIAETFSNAWNFNSNGDIIIQNLANALNNLLEAINNIIKSKEFQDWLNNCSDKFRKISEKIAEINWQPTIDALGQLGSTIGTFALDVLEGLTDAFKWLIEHPEVAGTILTLVAAYKALSGVLALITALKSSETIAFIIGTAAKLSDITETAILVAMYAAEAVQAGIATAATWLLNAAIAVLTSPITLVVAAIAALIAIIVLCVKNWENIKETVTNVVNVIKEKVSVAFNSIKTAISNAMDSIKITISNVWNAIWGTIRNVINSILGGIESFVNGTIKGINKLLSGISSVANAVGSLIGLDPINLQINTISLPRLAKGGVLTQPTTVLAGEYSGARSNPEIVTPQNIMYDTMRRAIEDTEFHNGNSGQTIHLTVNVSNKKLGQILLDDLRDMTRQTGKDIEALVGG